MSKLIHFEGQLKKSISDPILFYMEQHDGKLEVLKTRKNQLTSDLVGMKFLRMSGNIPVFESMLVEESD